MLTQFALGSRNAGLFGYAGNAVGALALGWGVKKFMRNPSAGDLVTLGGFVGIVLRAVQEFTPFGQLVSSQFRGLGDLGVYGVTTYFVPLAEAGGPDRGALALPAAAVPVRANGGVSGLGMATGARYAASGRYS